MPTSSESVPEPWRGPFAREAADERPSVDHWMISSARTRSDCGIVNPSAFAAFMLITNSNFIGCSTGEIGRL